jgi:hypothetical protein
MLETYQAILHGDRLEWSGEGPGHLQANQAVRVHVTILDKATNPPPATGRGPRMAAALEELAAIQALKEIGDPAAWERETRQDRPLPGRDE